ncbi:MAG: NRDE family protein [Oxalobacter sp.]|nr:NRDE family protein [Oxalobacter sp.]
MCLIVFGWQVKADKPLIAASNRDEFYARPALPAHRWQDFPQIYAGRDLEGGGTWLGIAEDRQNNGYRFAALTNVRAPNQFRTDAPTRGLLVSGFLVSSFSPEVYIDSLKQKDHLYNGFNLLTGMVGTENTLVWYSNLGNDNPLNGKPLKPGFYGISNALLDTPWPKLLKTRKRFSELVDKDAGKDAYFEMLSDTQTVPDDQLPETGVPYEWEKLLSAVCIQSKDYGTRVSTLVEMYPDTPPLLQERIIHP